MVQLLWLVTMIIAQSHTKTVSDYGPLTSNTEFKSALLAAVADLKSGDTLSVPIGDFTIDGEIVFKSLKHIKVVTDGAIIRQTKAKSATFKYLQCSGVEQRGFTLYGKGTETPWKAEGGSWNGVAGILIDECSDVLITKNKLYNHAGGGIRWSSGVKGITVERNHVEGVGGHVVQDNGSDVAIGSTGNNNFGGLFNTDVIISHNDVSKHCFGICAASKPNADLSRNVTISHNTIHDIGGQHGVYVSDVNLVRVHKNDVSHTALIAIKIQNTGSATDNHVTYNTIDSCGQGIAVGSLGKAISRIATVSNNDIAKIGTSDGDGDGVYLFRCTDVQVKDNRINDVARYGIGCFGVSGRIESNSIMRSKHAGLFLVMLDNTYTSNNLIRDAIQFVGPGASGRYAYIEASVAESPVVAKPVWTSNNDMLESRLPDQEGFANSVLTQKHVIRKIKNMGNGTSKRSRFETEVIR